MVAENGSVFAILDKHPVTPGHLLVLRRRHVADYYAMTTRERNETEELARMLRDKSMGEDAKITGFNIGSNCGASAGQTELHAHMHLIPRRIGDIDDPRGGVRGVLPERRIY